MSNIEIWESLATTDPAHTKPFNRAGGFKGTAIKPQWVIQRLTEEFGPCGVGWGVNEPSFQVVTTRADVLVYCTVSGWFGNREQVVWGVGGDKVAAERQSGGFFDDEAFKKAFTDAIMNAFKFIGVGADVHLGRFDDSKYVQEAAEAFKAPNVSVHPDGPDWWGASGLGMSAAQAKREGWGDRMDEWLGFLPTISSAVAWRDWCAENADDIKRLPKGWRIQLRDEAEARGHELGAITNERKAA